MDVDRIQQEMDVKTLQNNIMHITFCNIEAELVSKKINQVGIQFWFLFLFIYLFIFLCYIVCFEGSKDWFLLYCIIKLILFNTSKCHIHALNA